MNISSFVELLITYMYKALYRSYRPQTFFDVVGQHHITKTFQNAIIQQKFTHAYLISGPRGTGKTTLAKIFAKAVNCLDLQPNAEPCNKCAVCLGVNDGSLSDIIEIDAASNNGVDEIRELREKTKYAPTLAKYKVYIIDEVHMLSTGAFNALLKTLEEPPKHVIFILATTELHKIPVTIISRCQRFEVKKMTEGQIIERLNFVLTQEAIDFEQEAVAVIARLSDGGMRDALSLVDQAIAYCDERILVSDIYDVAGIATSVQIQKFLVALTEQDDVQVLAIIEQLFEAGKDLVQFMEQLLLALRDILIAKTQAGSKDAVVFAKQFEMSFLYQAIDVFNTCQHQLKYTSFPRLAIEAMAIQFMYPSEIKPSGVTQPTRNEQGNNKKIQLLQQTVLELQSQIAVLSEEIKRKSEEKLASVIQTIETKPVVLDDYDGIYRVLAEATLTRDSQSLNNFQQIWNMLKGKAMNSEIALLLDSTPRAASGNVCILTTKFVHVKEQLEQEEMQGKITTYIQEITGKETVCLIVLEDEWQQLREQFALKWKNKEVTMELLEKLTKLAPKIPLESPIDIEVISEPAEQLSFLEENIQDDQQDDIINVATDLFGDIVEVI